MARKKTNITLLAKCGVVGGLVAASDVTGDTSVGGSGDSYDGAHPNASYKRIIHLHRLFLHHRRDSP
ncbi:hypothetical protein QVD17_15315 [Tagetes erecta]|uniref:Uncharacterized protein n=1 Tax=Tagetes erecta TaxID=13708 RepID=A0AAD8KS53_TARER|nr:hypothetical protein QVD17_15315 [Tagetes erecta]